MAQKEVALRKRQQIAKANRTMFLWVAGASVLIGIAAVLAVFLVRTLVFNTKVISEKNNTASVLEINNEVVQELESNVRVLNSNEGLNSTKTDSDDRAVQAVLDALPADANSLAVGSSLTNKLLSGVNGVTIESVSVDPVVGEEISADAVTDASVSVDESGGNEITFRFAISGNASALKAALNRVERSIRPVSITSMTMESQSRELLLTVEGHTFYQPARTVELGEKTVRP